MQTSTTNSRHTPRVDGLHRCVRLACGSALLSIVVPAWAACDITAPASLQTVTCTGAAPNPFTTAVTSTAGATGVTVQVGTGAQLAVSIGWENVAVGRTRLDEKHAGLYWTRAGSAGGYLDAVVMQSRYNGDATSARGIGIDVDGDGTTASVEVGKPLVRLGQSAWWLEPQLQVIWQRTSVDDTCTLHPMQDRVDCCWPMGYRV